MDSLHRCFKNVGRGHRSVEPIKSLRVFPMDSEKGVADLFLEKSPLRFNPVGGAGFLCAAEAEGGINV